MEPTRPEFLFLSPFEKVLFYTLAVAATAAMAAQFAARWRLWRAGRVDHTDGRPDGARVARWTRNVGAYVLGQRKVRQRRKRGGAPMHLAIFYGFLSLLLATTLLGINTYSPIKFHRGAYYLAYEATFDALGLLFVIGVGWAIARRVVAERQTRELARSAAEHGGAQAPQAEQGRRAPISRAPADYGVLALLLFLGVGGYALEAARIRANPQPFDGYSFVGYGLAGVLPPIGPLGYRALWWAHSLGVLAFLALLPRFRIRHVLTAIPVAAERPATPIGKLRTIPMEEVEETEKVGASHAADLTKWARMSLDACMECGRCTEACPAWRVGKTLNPKQLVVEARGAMESGEALAPRLTEEALWQCTTCMACVEACPVLIRHVDLVVDVRRNLVSEGRLVGSGATMLRQVTGTGHAWGARAEDRERWMEGLGVPLCRDGQPFEWLFWVGCAGATDPEAMRATRATAELLRKAGVSFACLGREEACTGDPARRIGEEFLAQDFIGRNVATFERYGVRKVVTGCPHCLNTLRHEYAEMGAELEVRHHSQLIAELIAEGRLAPVKAANAVLHDPCYLARANDETAAPRALLSGVREPAHAGRATLCCGAGGGRMWMDEAPNERPADARTAELLATGAQEVAVACPFCRIMLRDAIGRTAPEGVRLLDLAEMVREANPDSE